MQTYETMDISAARLELAAVQEALAAWQAKALRLNMARGKPGKAQLDQVSDILTVLQQPEQCISDGVDARNYGELAGLPAARRYWADVLGCQPEQTLVGGNSSLTLMYEVIAKAYSHGLLHSP